MNTVKVSVVVCCYNSAKRIESTLKYLAAQIDISNQDWDIILINNASTDNTESEAIRVWDALNSSISFRIVNELAPGLTMARKRGILESDSEIILFCDDDNWLNPEYLRNAIAHKIENLDLGIWGAAESIGVYEVEKPKWIDPYLRMLAIFNNGSTLIASSIEDNVVVSGAAMCISREFANIYLQFLEDEPQRQILDRTGNIPLAGGDSDMHYVALKNGYKIAYFKDLVFHHFMPAERLKKSYLLKLKKYMIMSSVLLNYINKETSGTWSFKGLAFHLIKNFFVNFFEFRMTIAGMVGHAKGKKAIRNLVLEKNHEN